MAVVQPFNSQLRDADFFSIPGTASANSVWIDMRKAKVWFVDVNFAASGTAAGNFKIEATEDPLLTSGIVVVTPTISYASAGLTPSITAGVLAYPVAGGSVMLVYEHTPSFCRYSYTFATAGAAVKVWSMGRSI